MHAQRKCIAFSVLAIGADYRWGQAMPLVERGRACGDIGLGSETHAFNAIAVVEARQVTKERVFQDRHEIALEENAGRLTARILHDFYVVRCWRVSRDTGIA